MLARPGQVLYASVLCVGVTQCVSLPPEWAVRDRAAAIEIAEQDCSPPDEIKGSWTAILSEDYWIVSKAIYRIEIRASDGSVGRGCTMIVTSTK